MKTKIFGLVTAVALVFTMSACSMLDHWGDQFNQSWNGVKATMTTYNQYGVKIDSVSGQSFRVSRDDRFDGSDSAGNSKEDSQVLLISIGNEHISHVGSSMIMAENGLTDIMTSANAKVSLENNDRGTPWLNDLIEKHRNLWSGKAKTIMIRSQDGTPIAVYSGNKVNIFKTDVPKSTWFEVDGKMLFVYRSDYTVYDTNLLQK